MLPRVLVTGFSAFPGAPVNPTEALVAALERRRAELDRICHLVTEVLDVDYRALPGRLVALAEPRGPDIAIHFGLSARATGFMLERVAKNAIGSAKPDNAGLMPQPAWIVEDGQPLATSLPVEPIHAALAAKGLPVDYSDDAGDYLCNFLFYHSCGALCRGFAPEMAGFIHVQTVKQQGGTMTIEDLAQGAETIVATCCDEWHAAQAVRDR